MGSEMCIRDRTSAIDRVVTGIGELANAGYDPVYGARPLKRAIQRELETPIAKAILAGQYSEGDVISLDVASNALAFR